MHGEAPPSFDKNEVGLMTEYIDIPKQSSAVLNIPLSNQPSYMYICTTYPCQAAKTSDGLLKIISSRGNGSRARFLTLQDGQVLQTRLPNSLCIPLKLYMETYTQISTHWKSNWTSISCLITRTITQRRIINTHFS